MAPRKRRPRIPSTRSLSEEYRHRRRTAAGCDSRHRLLWLHGIYTHPCDASTKRLRQIIRFPQCIDCFFPSSVASDVCKAKRLAGCHDTKCSGFGFID
jgi:hypothetical protein